jgi:phosphohistidine phosphatase SixA/predicted NUDIX family NTP pyrophosphohydrolase
MIRAAGAVLWREVRPFELEIAIVHRPKFEDWTFPKGKVEDGESAIQAAYREVLEETSVDPIFGPYIGDAEYEIDGEMKKVHYWMAKAPKVISNFVPNDEIDRLEWVSTKQARHFLTYDVDREILKFFRDTPRHGNVIVLLRHAKAIKRSDWSGDDSDRPLSFEGQKVANKLAQHLSMFALDEIHSSDAYRCMSTIEPLYQKLGVTKVLTDQLSEYLFEKDDNLAAKYVRELAKFGGNYLVCSHNPILPIILDYLTKYPEDFNLDRELDPADAWIVHHRGGKVFAVNFLKSPSI